ncbi:MAG: flagellar basal body P-ring formation chaperone FlgA [Hyphomicrobiaceae bacterium]|nr:flagellar basal body P-ring formation chaperone FlgA [Hyphomicrobiaceae bacterium]
MLTALIGALAMLGALSLPAAPAAAQAQQEMLLPVPTVTIYPNDEIGEEHIMDRAFIAQTVTRGSVQEDRSAVVGKVAKRTLLKGAPIPVNALREPYLVVTGKLATVVYVDGGLTITGQATALQSGAIGDTVSLRNGESGLQIRGIVAKDGSVRVGGP